MEESTSIAKEIGKLIEVLIRQWQLIVSIVLVCVIVAGVVSITSPKNYQASALVASIKVVSSVSFGSTIETMSEEQLLTSGGAGLVDRRARLQSYVQLVESPAVAQQVLDELGAQFPDANLSVSSLLSAVSGSLVSGSDSIMITVVYNDPELAAIIANTWASAYVNQVNDIYSEKGAAESYAAVLRQMEKSDETYQQAQRDLEAFLAESQVAELERRITEQEAIVEDLSAARNSILTQAVGDLDAKLAQAYRKRRLVDEVLASAQDMRSQVEQGGEGAASSNALALNLLKTQVFAVDRVETTSSGGAPNTPSSGASYPLMTDSPSLLIQTSPISMTADAMLADLDGLILALESRRLELDADIRQISLQLANAQSQTVASEEDQTKVLRSSQEAQEILGVNLSVTPSEKMLQDMEQVVRDLESQLESEKAREEVRRQNALGLRSRPQA